MTGKHWETVSSHDSSTKLGKVKKSMARLLTVLSERKKLRDSYRKQLENEYVERKRQEELSKIAGT